MHNIKVKLTIDIFIVIFICLTFIVAVNDLFSWDMANLQRIRGCFLFSVTLIGEELGYYITTGMMYKKKMIMHTVLFSIELAIMITVFAFMISGFTMGRSISYMIAFLLTVYPAKCFYICFQDVKKLFKLYNVR